MSEVVTPEKKKEIEQMKALQLIPYVDCRDTVPYVSQ